MVVVLMEWSNKFTVESMIEHEHNVHVSQIGLHSYTREMAGVVGQEDLLFYVKYSFSLALWT